MEQGMDLAVSEGLGGFQEGLMPVHLDHVLNNLPLIFTGEVLNQGLVPHGGFVGLVGERHLDAVGLKGQR